MHAPRSFQGVSTPGLCSVLQQLLVVPSCFSQSIAQHCTLLSGVLWWPHWLIFKCLAKQQRAPCTAAVLNSCALCWRGYLEVHRVSLLAEDLLQSGAMTLLENEWFPFLPGLQKGVLAVKEMNKEREITCTYITSIAFSMHCHIGTNLSPKKAESSSLGQNKPCSFDFLQH